MEENELTQTASEADPPRYLSARASRANAQFLTEAEIEAAEAYLWARCSNSC